MSFKVGDRVLYCARCPDEHIDWLVVGKSIGYISRITSTGANVIEWKKSTIDWEEYEYYCEERDISTDECHYEEWYVSEGSLCSLFVGPIHKWQHILDKVKDMRETRKELGYAF
jgi:hypothetical protein